ncbi:MULTISPECIES: hypothetical protein [Arthrobacter]|uniref:hypothetical protein n=1 Tax=Arthrobacter TaxID=1663 RepID=UPI001472D6EC|nr:hypothetical protein [Arthrobacter psychrochitiniphilus]NYG18932.1 hypothetical protein [Arthrobacter psychrochitiniphilus]
MTGHSAFINAEKIFGTVERIEGSVIEQTEMDAADYQAGVEVMRRKPKRAIGC